MFLLLNYLNYVDAKDIVQQLIQAKEILPPISNKIIKGKFDLKHQIITTPIEFKHCTFLDEVDLRYCECKELVSFVDCTFEKEFNSGDEIHSHSIYHKDLIPDECG